MFEFIILLFFILLFVVYIYFGYYQDYKRNPKDFTRSIIGMPLGIIAKSLGLNSVDKHLKKWANNSDTKSDT
jgi:hypothetical protein